jgi:hypothetical protein
MDDHLFLQSAARLDSGLADLETELATWYTWNVLAWQNTLGFRQPYASRRRYRNACYWNGWLDVALAAAGEPYVKIKIMGIKLVGKLPNWVSAKDIVELRRYNVTGGRGYILEYYGPGLKTLSAWDRHVIANMGTELGATTVFRLMTPLVNS